VSGAIVEAIGLRKTYFGKIPVPVLHGVDLAVMPSEFVAVIGQSGSGKSTLLNLLGALDHPTAGVVRIAGRDITALSSDELAGVRNTSLGFVFQEHDLLPEFSCLENALMSILIGERGVTPADRTRVVELLERVGLEDELDKRPDAMSGGQRQRCAIVRALANRPRAILADEPTGNLDRVSGANVFAMMREISRETGVAFIMVTHDDRLARQADRVLEIVDGVLHAREIATL